MNELRETLSIVIPAYNEEGNIPRAAQAIREIMAGANISAAVYFVDGGIRSGVDVFRALALGADAVLIGRPVVPFVYGAGAEGLKVYLDKLVAELRDTMTMCGTPTLADIGRDNVIMF